MLSDALTTGLSVRLASRNNTHKTTTTSLAPTYIQANLLILPSRYASEFRLLCARNPVPCPLLAETHVGQFDSVVSRIPRLVDKEIAVSLDIRTDTPKYTVYKNGSLVKDGVEDVIEEWTDDHIAFLIGCSFSFENALKEAGLEPMNMKRGRTVPMYRTCIPLFPAGVFTGNVVVSMRVYRKDEVERVRDITRVYETTHGEPMDWGWDALKRLGIRDIDVPDWGMSPLVNGELFGKLDEEEKGNFVPLFWGCGVTPQEVVMNSKLDGTVMGHMPGHMLVLDWRDEDIVSGN